MLHDLDALLVSDPINICYLTGFMGLSPDERESYLLITSNEAYLFTSGLYLEQAKEIKNLELKIYNSQNFSVIEISREYPLSRRLKDCFTSLKQNHSQSPIKLGFEEVDLTFAEYRKLKQEINDIDLIPTQGRIEELRKIKNVREIEYIRQAAKLTDQCFLHIIKQIKPGITEMQIAWEIESFFRKVGAESAFSPIVAFGKNSSQPHYVSTYNSSAVGRQHPRIAGRQATYNQLVLLDFGAKVNGYCADITRVIFLGKPTREQQKAYSVLHQIQSSVIQKMKQYFDVSIHRSQPISGAELDRIAKESLINAGYPPYPHSLGHSLGLAIHESPRLSVNYDEILKPGHVVTVEPGIYLEGKFGIRIEDLILIKENGIEVLSKSPKKLTII